MSNLDRRLSGAAKTAINRYRRPRLKLPKLSSRTGRSTFFFLTPDYDIPSGGVRVIYRHVDILNEAGISATVLHQREGFRCSWFGSNTKITDIRSSSIGPNDILVVSELDVDLVMRLPDSVRHVILNQSGHLTWKHSGDAIEQHYKNSSSLLGVIAVSEYSAQLLRFAFPGRLVLRVRNSVDPSHFYCSDGPTSRRITYFPRRGREDSLLVRHILDSRGSLRDWNMQALDGLKQNDFAAALRSSRITLSLSYQEGFGLPAAEAMACGNYVVGFHGYGGREFMLPDFTYPIETGDVLAIAEAIEYVVEQDSKDDQWCKSRGQRASAYILDQYSQSRERVSVVNAYRNLADYP